MLFFVVGSGTGEIFVWPSGAVTLVVFAHLR